MPLEADLSRLQCVVGAAALRAGLEFGLPLPLRDGCVVLPTLGAADLRPDGKHTAHLTADAHGAVITGSGEEVRLPAPGRPRPRGWVPALRVRTTGTEGGFDFLLDDLDPYAAAPGRPAPPRLDSPAAARWQHMAERAGALLARTDRGLAQGLAAALTAVTPRPRRPVGTVVALSSSDAFGGVEMSTPPEAADLAVGLVHEFRHMKLNAVLDCVDLYTEADREPEPARYYAPWRDDPRPLPGYLHGVFAYFDVVDVWHRLSRDRDPALRRRARFEFAHWRVQTWDAYTLLCASPRLTAAGREFTAMMAEGAAHWTGQASVPDDLALLAREAVIAHRLGWRVHYLRPSAGQIAELAEAWLSGVAAPPRRHVDTLFRGVRPAPDLTGYGVRLRRGRVRARGQFLEHPPSGGPRPAVR
ncbi:HEXXH motif-containing putative peptide modification protein [Streptomyces sparsogenes]|uniref:aKG-HExxH-type peptide beta-hydroxylase n=1 Tax=Streptomyces sparsogenes TaxID=67365 RepID=UPI0033171C1C